MELEARPLGEFDRDGSLDEVDEGGTEAEELILGSGRAGIIGWVDCSFSENLALEAASGVSGEKDGGGFTGAASSGDVMSSALAWYFDG